MDVPAILLTIGSAGGALFGLFWLIHSAAIQAVRDEHHRDIESVREDAEAQRLWADGEIKALRNRVHDLTGMNTKAMVQIDALREKIESKRSH